MAETSQQSYRRQLVLSGGVLKTGEEFFRRHDGASPRQAQKDAIRQCKQKSKRGVRCTESRFLGSALGGGQSTLVLGATGMRVHGTPSKREKRITTPQIDGSRVGNNLALRSRAGGEEKPES